jgi:hypothetical protein
LQEKACWSITKEHPKKTKIVEKDNAQPWPTNNFSDAGIVIVVAMFMQMWAPLTPPPRSLKESEK